MSDLIRREDAIKALYKYSFVSKDVIEKEIKAIPSADRPQGKWIFDPEILCSDIGVYSAGYRCSVCGEDYFKVDGMRFCPSCGARMKGADDEID